MFLMSKNILSTKTGKAYANNRKFSFFYFIYFKYFYNKAKWNGTTPSTTIITPIPDTSNIILISKIKIEFVNMQVYIKSTIA